MLLGLRARLLGIRIVVKQDDHVVIELPRWLAKDKTKRQIADALEKDAAILGREVKVTFGDRLVRADIKQADG